MKIFTTAQVAELDRYTIENEPITAIDLMERASMQVADWIAGNIDYNQRIAVFAGPGNNGGDALAIGRILTWMNFNINVFIPDTPERFSDCFRINLTRLNEIANFTSLSWAEDAELPDLIEFDYIIDGLFGAGLSRKLSGFPARLVHHINNSGIPILSIDIPSGLMGEDNCDNDLRNIIRATHTLTFEFPKLSFFFRENELFTGQWEILPIGLHEAVIQKAVTSYFYSDIQTMARILKPRNRFSHKGTFGHALLIAGSYGKMGAAVLAAMGCLRSGAGLLTVHLPKSGNQIMQIALPEAMVTMDESENAISGISLSASYRAIGIGPGIGKLPITVKAFRNLLEISNLPLVIDADALNILSENRKFLDLLPAGSVLTPHPVEFERLTSKAGSEYERLMLARDFCKSYNVFMVLKGRYTATISPDGSCWFNTTGNPGMATAGSGDVLTGILTGLLAQGYTSHEAAILGVYLHGLAGDLSLGSSSEEALLASDIALNLGNAFSSLKSNSGFGKAEKKNHF